MPVEWKDIIVLSGTYELLKANGKADRAKGVSLWDGWNELAKELGFSSGRTPAREAYEDGWYEGERRA
jgi:hypothetical protein